MSEMIDAVIASQKELVSFQGDHSRFGRGWYLCAIDALQEEERETVAGPFSSSDEADQEGRRINARAAIEAMREPTVEMEIAGTEQWLCEAAMEDRSGANWRAMIDAALA